MALSVLCGGYTILLASLKATTLSFGSSQWGQYGSTSGCCITYLPHADRASYIFGFTLARLQYLSYYGIFCNPAVHGATGASPGECYYYLRDPYKTGMMLHLYTILPAAFLVVFQFTPVIRYKAMIFHRLNGYAVITLSLIANAGALIVLPHAFGGDMTTRVWGGMTVISTTGSLVFAYVNIKVLQIDQHRAWMMRAWAYVSYYDVSIPFATQLTLPQFSTIVTIRLIMYASAAIISGFTSLSTTYPCAQINFTLGKEGTLSYYPDCIAYYNGTHLGQRVVVTPNFNSENPIEIAAALGVSFGTAGWLALWIHAILIEVYVCKSSSSRWNPSLWCSDCTLTSSQLHMTPAESTRLRQVSYERQLARGSTRPGYAGMVAERFGDAAPYEPRNPGNLDSAKSDEHVRLQVDASSSAGVSDARSILDV
jgi:hypothetical protein